MKIGDKVNTPHGLGEIVAVDDSNIYSRGKNWGVKLENNPFWWAPKPAYYWADELTAAEKSAP